MNDATRKQILHYFDGSLSDRDVADLANSLQDDPQCRQEFPKLAAIEYELRTSDVRDDSDSATAEPV